MKRKLINSLIIVLFCFILVYAHAAGITGVTQKDSTPGCTCHGINPTTSVIVSINGPDTLIANQSAEYSVTISGGPLVAAGTDIAVSNGALAPVSNDLQLLNSELTHVFPKVPVAGVVTFNFEYTAPPTSGEQIIYANGNSVNLNGQITGDQWNYAPNKVIKVLSIAGIKNRENALTYNLKQNYPNPFNPSTTIRYSILETGLVTLKVYNAIGEVEATIVNQEKSPGTYEVNFDATNFSSGVYFYRLQAGSFVETKKMIVLK